MRNKTCRFGLTALLTIFSDGSTMPPLFVVKGKERDPTWKKDADMKQVFVDAGMAEIQITHQDNAWMDRAIFLKWVKDIFLPWTVDKRSTETPMILIMDNLGAHINPEVLQLFVDNHVIIVPLPPHASHFLQPLDVIFIMQVLKHFKDKATKAFRRLHKKRLIKEKELIIMLFKFLLVDSSGLQRGSAWTMH
eukprot:jgi/Tetstr1/427412/TSEL_017576.t1